MTEFVGRLRKMEHQQTAINIQKVNKLYIEEKSCSIFWQIQIASN